jgi:hypothetical protein
MSNLLLQFSASPYIFFLNIEILNIIGENIIVKNKLKSFIKFLFFMWSKNPISANYTQDSSSQPPSLVIFTKLLND